MRPLRDATNRALSLFGLSLRRLPLHRFDAMDDILDGLVGAGYRPRRVIDAGANRGQWTRHALSRFPEARFDLIEPQPGCREALDRLARRHRRLEIHPVALAIPGGRVRMIGSGAQRAGTGAYVARPGEDEPDALEVPSTTLDALFAGPFEPVETADRGLLKLDLEGHEIEALAGAAALLSRIEVVFTEVYFYEVHRNGRPTFTDLLDVLRGYGFQLYDVAALAARPRDGRLRMGDVVFVRADSPLAGDDGWE
jgi:FkbM family methyltransferase